MFSRLPIRHKMYVGGGVLCVALAMLAFSGLRGPYAYRHLAWTITQRSAEIPLASRLIHSVSQLRAVARPAAATDTGSENFVTGMPLPDPLHAIASSAPTPSVNDPLMRDVNRNQLFRMRLVDARIALQEYRAQLERNGPESSLSLDNDREEWKTVREIERSLERLDRLESVSGPLAASSNQLIVENELSLLFQLANSLPGHLHARMQSLVDEVRFRYRTWIYMAWGSGTLGACLAIGLMAVFYRSIFRPLRQLIDESRKISGGDLGHRIRLSSQDEMAELAAAMNDMTDAFQRIRDNLDAQVQQRTREVVRSEQLASVGFLAAGVAHEINNPLASIAWCAESLGPRIRELLGLANEDHAEEHAEEHGDEQADERWKEEGGDNAERAAKRGAGDASATAADDASAAELRIIERYLKRIQDEAFRCKGITEKLLDFSRLGDVQRQRCELGELVDGVLEMTRTIGKYRGKRIEFGPREPVAADIHPQEFKQVVLNLVTNALDSLDAGGLVRVSLARRGNSAAFIVDDNGCGMTEEVLKHLFEPFFTRRREGGGTGLGLSITYRIVQEHGGRIEASSGGPGQGSRLEVLLPLAAGEKPLAASEMSSQTVAVSSTTSRAA
ncbi:MAG: sensor histidine kinase [Planctomycetota bacterium]